MHRALVKDRAAENDLIEIWVYTLQTWGEAQAEKYLGILQAEIEHIGRDPTAGRSRFAIRADYWSQTIEHHIVFCTFNDTEVRIRRVLHGAMDVGMHLSG